MGIEPTSRAWEAHVLPLYDTRNKKLDSAKGFFSWQPVRLPRNHPSQFQDALGDIRFFYSGSFLQPKAFAAETRCNAPLNESATEFFLQAALGAGEVSHEPANK